MRRGVFCEVSDGGHEDRQMKLRIEPHPEEYTEDKAAMLMDEETDKLILIGCEGALATATNIMNAINNIEGYEEALQQIAQWSNAYPTTVFPEPDLDKARMLLEAGGITLDSISAHCMRHVIKGVGDIAKNVLGGQRWIK